MVAEMPGHTTFRGRSICTTVGSMHKHDEPVLVDGPDVSCINASWPRIEVTPFGERLAAFGRGEIAMAVFRWHTWAALHPHDPLYLAWQHCMAAALRLIARLRLRYDSPALVTILRNRIRAALCRKLPFLEAWHLLGPLARNKEHRVYCTELCVLVYLATQIKVLAGIGRQPLPAPVHPERLYAIGHLRVVRDYGLIVRLNRHLEKMQCPSLSFDNSED